MALMTAEQTAAELQRKKNLGIAPTSAANNTAYGNLTAQPLSAGAAGGAASGIFAGLPNGTVPQTSKMIGPILPGTTRPDIPQPVSASTAAAASNPNNTNQYGGMGSGTYGPPSMPEVNTVSAPPTKMSSTTYEPPVTAQPMSASAAQQPAPDYAALAAARTALALQQRTTIANQQKASADSAYNSANLRTKDDRTLGDFSRTQTANPFSNMGRKSFQEGLIGRERTQADADASAALATQKGNIDALLADYQNATEDEKVRIMDELQRADRSYNLELAKFEQDQANYDKSFNYNSGQDAIKNGQTQQQIDYTQDPNSPNNIGQGLSNYGQTLTNSLNELKLGNYSEEQKQQAQLFEQQIKTGQMTQEAAEYNLKELKDPKSATNQAKALDLQMKQLEAKNLPEQQRLELQQLKKQIAQIGVVHYKPQTASEIEMDKVQLDTAKKQLEILNGKTPAVPKVDPKLSAEAYAHYKDQVDNSSYSKSQKLSFAESVKDEMTDTDYAKFVKGIQ